jgi:DNA segregation ATPase FtsK/SpoIIIE-like protein
MSTSIVPADLVATVQDVRRRTVVAVKQGTVVVVLLALWYRLGNLFLALLVGALLAGTVLASVDLVRFVRWLPARRAALLAAQRPVPGLRCLWRSYRAEVKRLAYLAKQWPVACLSQNLTGPSKAIPALFDVAPTLDNSVTARVASSRMGVDPDDIAARADRIAKVIGCQEVSVRETSPGCADLVFSWTNALAATLPLSQLPPSRPGTIAYGKRSDGSAATIEQHKSVLIGGLTRRGKSVLCKAMVADLIRKRVPVDLYVADTKDGVELVEFSRHVGERLGTVRVARYEMTAEGAAEMVEEMVAEKRRRGAAMRARGIKQHRPTAAEPLLIGIFDETLPLHEMLKAGTKGPAGEVGYSGSAMGCALWLNAQVAHANVIGQLRELIPQRISFATPTPEVTETILGKGAYYEGGAACHKLGDKVGLGWSGSDSESRPAPFRAALVTDEEAEQLAEGRIPTMPPPFPVAASVEATSRPTLRERLAAVAATALVQARSAAIGAAVAVDGVLAAVHPAPEVVRIAEDGSHRTFWAS